MKTDLLQELIQSLSSAEKRYFTLYATRHITEEPNPYVLLFRLLDKRKAINQADFEKEYQAKVGLKKFKNIKSYLGKLVLESLEGFYKENDIEIKLGSYYNQAKIMIKKGLYNQSSTLIQKGSTLAQKHGYNNYVAMFQFLQLKYFSLIKINFNKNKLIENTEKLYESIHQYLDIQKEEIDVYVWLNKLYHYARSKPKIRAQLDFPTLTELQNKFDRFECYTVAGQIVHSELLAIRNNQEGRIEDGYKIREQMHQKLKPLKIKGDDKNTYCNFLLNFAAAALMLQQYQRFNELLDELYVFFQANYTSDLSISKDILLRFFILKLEHLIVIEKLIELEKLLQEAVDYTSKYIAALNPVLLKVVQLSIIESYLKLKDYNACLNSISAYWDCYKDDANIASRIKVDFMMITCHYELENFQFLENYIKTLKRKKYNDANFSTFLNAIQKACKSPSRTERKQVFINLRAHFIEAYKNSPYELNKLLAWVDKYT
ncbi:hypothetical protein [Aureispira sp. CCB-QB1]|uniref:hypothetical protein n=1 Tax=Aureispira sp. CCB-QB1 TaxID=1313421 RepID=UPI000696E940|nr:hypothetical protein [Aureispira sp. CCB-QB1]